MSVEVNDYLENILDDLGGCGRFQFLLTFYVLGTKVVVSWSALMMSFGGAVPEWSCSWEDSLGEKYMPNATFTKKCSIENSSMDFTCVNKQALGYATCEAPINSQPSRLEEDGSVFNQFQ
jgi:hypothetical protein